MKKLIITLSIISLISQVYSKPGSTKNSATGLYPNQTKAMSDIKNLDVLMDGIVDIPKEDDLIMDNNSGDERPLYHG